MMTSRISENYLRVIYQLSEKKGYARPKDIATTLNISGASVTEMVQKLSKENLVRYDRYGPVTLTEEGKKRAETLKMRYQIFVKLFEMAGVSANTAYTDACHVEHEVSEETLTKLVEFVGKLGSVLP